MKKRHRPRDLQPRQTNPQTSTTLDPRVIAKPPPTTRGRFQNEADFTPSLLSDNNFINFCATLSLPLTNGKQVENGSCNPAPIGVIPSIDHLPSLKFAFPPNGGFIKGSTPFTVKLAVRNLHTGNTVNSRTNFLAAPQQLDSDGLVNGRTSIVIEKLGSLDDTTPMSGTTFAFSKGANGPAVGGVYEAQVNGGLAEGFYRISSVTTGANFQPVVVPVLQHGAVDDAVYFTVTKTGERGTSPSAASTSSSSRGATESTMPVQQVSVDATTQNSTILASFQISSGFATDGQDPPVEGQVASLTSVNNFINYCLTTTTGSGSPTLTNGQQLGSGSCNPIPIGAIPAASLVPSFKFTSPKNFASIPPKSPFNIKLSSVNLIVNKTNPINNYLGAPQQLDPETGRIRGYARVVIEALSALNQTELTDPTKVALATSLNDTMEAYVPNGLPAGFYRLSSFALTENHYPVVVPYSIGGATNDVVYFAVGDGGGGSTAANSQVSVPASTPTSNPASTATATNPAKDTGVSSTVLGAAIGATVGGIALLAAIGFLVFFLRRRRRRRDEEPMYDIPYPTSSDTSTVEPFFASPTRPLPQPPSSSEKTTTSPTTATETEGGYSFSAVRSSRMSTVSVAPSYHTVAPLRPVR